MVTEGVTEGAEVAATVVGVGRSVGGGPVATTTSSGATVTCPLTLGASGDVAAHV